MADLGIHNSYTLLRLGKPVPAQDLDGLVRCAYHDMYAETGCPRAAAVQPRADATAAGGESAYLRPPYDD